LWKRFDNLGLVEDDNQDVALSADAEKWRQLAPYPRSRIEAQLLAMLPISASFVPSGKPTLALGHQCFYGCLEPLAYHPGHAGRLQSRGGSRRPGMIRIRHDASVTTTEPAIAVAGDWSWIASRISERAMSTASTEARAQCAASLRILRTLGRSPRLIRKVRFSFEQIDCAKLKRAKNLLGRQHLAGQCSRDHTIVYTGVSCERSLASRSFNFRTEQSHNVF
jgi:hypothetical protein